MIIVSARDALIVKHSFLQLFVQGFRFFDNVMVDNADEVVFNYIAISKTKEIPSGDPENPNNPGNPNTSDSFPVMPMVALIAMSAGLIIVFRAKKA